LFNQTFQAHDILLILVLVVLEGVLSVDNALVLGLLARRVPRHLRGRALTYGLGGAFIFRFIAVAAASWLLHVRWLKVVGGGYLLYLAIRHFTGESDDEPHHLAHEPAADAVQPRGAPFHFWYAVGVIELTDLAFAVDSILAAVALVAGQHSAKASQIHPKLWVVILGGMLGVLLVRVAAGAIVHLLERFTRLEPAAYVLVFLIGLKLLVDWAANVPGQAPRVNFHSPRSAGFWLFWGSMVATLAFGFLPHRPRGDSFSGSAEGTRSRDP
jgi:YkoY family integral membrane protein